MTQPGPTQPMTLVQAMQIAMAHESAGRLQEADSIAQQILTVQPAFVDAIRMRGLVAIRSGGFDAAADFFRQAISIQPLEARYYSDLAWALAESGETGQAMSLYRMAISMQSNLAEAHNGLGAVLQQSQQFEQALIEHQKAITIQPNFAQAYYNLSGALRWKGRIDDALAACRKALELMPDNPAAKENLGVTLLLNGEFEQGWRLYEFRPQAQQLLLMHRGRGEPQWDGTPLNGRRILVRCEQGLGDTVQFIRYIPLLASAGGKVIVECQPELISVIKDADGIAELIPVGADLPAFDTYCLLMSLPYLLHTTLETIPSAVPYLHANPQRVEFWKNRVNDEAGDRLKIGLVWAGKAHQTRKRSIPLSSFDQLSKIPGLWFFSLQKGGELEDHAAVTKSELRLTDWTAELTDLSETAELVEALDLVIAVDTAVAHLAAAMGKPVWLLLTALPDWRWMMNRDDSPWYPTMKLFRQRQSRPMGPCNCRCRWVSQPIYKDL